MSKTGYHEPFEEPLFGYGLFPDAAIVTAEQDINKHDSSSVAQGPGPGAPQHTSWRGSHRYRPYERKDKKPSGSSDPTSQQQQPWRQFSRSRSRRHGCGRGATPRFPSHISINNINDNYWVGPTSVPIAQDQLDPKIFQKKEVVVRNQG